VATDWIEIGSEKMRMARRQRMLSMDETAHRIRQAGFKLTGRTYDRWEKRGEVPRSALSAVSAVLGFDAGALLNAQPARVQWQQIAEALGEVVATQKVLVELLAEQRSVVGELGKLAADLLAVSDRLDHAASALEPNAASN